MLCVLAQGPARAVEQNPMPGELPNGPADELRLCARQQDPPDDRIKHCDTALGSRELGEIQDSVGFNYRGLAWLAKGDHERAGKDLDEAIRLNPDYASAYNSRGIVRSQMGEYGKAIEDYDTALRLKPGYAYAYANRGSAWLGNGSPDKAIADFDTAIGLLPAAHAELAYKGRGMAWQARGDLDRAMADFDAALKQNPNYAKGLVSRAYGHLARGGFEAAAADFTQVQKDNPDPYLAIGLTLALARGGLPIADQIDRYRKSFGNDAWPGPVMAMLAGEITPEQLFAKTADGKPKIQRERSCTARFYVGEWYLQRKDKVRARSELRRARDECSLSTPEYAIAGSELARMD